MTCIIFMMSHSSFLEANAFNKELNVFVKENHLSNEELNEIIGRMNKIESINKKELKHELEKIGRFKPRKENRNNLYYIAKNKGFELIEEKETIRYNVVSKRKNRFIFERKMENNLRIREQKILFRKINNIII